MAVKINFDEICTNFYANYIKNLSYIFYMINLNLLGTSICREDNIEKYKNEINSVYNEYKIIIENIFKSLEKNSFTKIDEFIDKIRDYKDPEKESKTISEEILKINAQLYKYLEEQLKDYQKKMEDIRQQMIKNEIENNFMNISFDNSIFKNFFSVNHIIEHSFLGVISFITLFFGPWGWTFSIGSHIVLALGNLGYDAYKKVDTIEENMKNFRKKLKIKFDGDKNDKILDYMIKLKQNIEKEIDLIVNSQNSEFNGIKENRKAFDAIINKFKEINDIKKHI